MAISQVRAQVNGQWYTLALQANGRYEANITAPGATSFNQPNKYYNVTVEATNTAGTVSTADASTLEGLKLFVRETVAPVITILSPSPGAYVSNNQQPAVFAITDEVGGSGVNPSSVSVTLDGVPVSAESITHSAITNGYTFTFTPPVAMGDGAHTVTVSASDYDGNQADQKTTTFTVDTIPPVLNVTSPAEDVTLALQSIVVAGTTNDASSSPVTVRVTVNDVQAGEVIVQSQDGFFTVGVNLTEGLNVIAVTATDAAGKSTIVTRNVVLDTSIPKILSAAIMPNPVDAGQTMLISVEVG